MAIIYEHEYSCDELCDIERDVSEAFDSDFNPNLEHLEIDEDKRIYKVTIEVLESN